MYDYSINYSTLLSLDEVLMRVSQEEIFSIIEDEKYEPVINKYFVSPFRNDDNNPGCYYRWYNNKLWFIDWADEPEHRDCFNFIQDYYNISFYESLEFINSYFKLGLGDSDYSIKPVKYELKRTKKQENKKLKKTKIYFKPRRWLKADKLFWLRSKIKRSDLIEDNVFPIVWYKLWSSKKRDWVIIRPKDICYAYTEFENEKVKIYRPYASDNKHKWLTNCSKDDVGFINKLPNHGDLLIITKSYKDARVLTNEGLTVVWIQNEGMIPNTNILQMFTYRFKKVVVFYDNDSVGIKAGKTLTDIINRIYPDKARQVYLPEELSEKDITDPSDLIEVNENLLTSFLYQNNLLINK